MYFMFCESALKNVKSLKQRCSPGLEKHGCHGMILPWSYHDHGETWSWSCHDNGMAAMFLSMVAMILGMIMVWLPSFPWSWYINVLSMFSQKVRAIHHYMAHLTAFRRIYALKVASQQNWAKNTPGNLGFFFDNNQTASSYYKTVAL